MQAMIATKADECKQWMQHKQMNASNECSKGRWMQAMNAAKADECKQWLQQKQNGKSMIAAEDI